MTNETAKPWGPLPQIDPEPNARMCGEVNGKIICCRSTGHEGKHATPFPSKRRHGPVWVYWGGPPLGPFGSCHHNDPTTHLYCGLEAGHEGDHLAPSNQGPGATLAEWDAAAASRAVPPAAPPDRFREGVEACVEEVVRSGPITMQRADLVRRLRSLAPGTEEKP
jgi:hypothetical protein